MKYVAIPFESGLTFRPTRRPPVRAAKSRRNPLCVGSHLPSSGTSSSDYSWIRASQSPLSRVSPSVTDAPSYTARTRTVAIPFESGLTFRPIASSRPHGAMRSVAIPFESGLTFRRYPARDRLSAAPGSQSPLSRVSPSVSERKDDAEVFARLSQSPLSRVSPSVVPVAESDGHRFLRSQSPLSRVSPSVYDSQFESAKNYYSRNPL